MRAVALGSGRGGKDAFAGEFEVEIVLVPVRNGGLPIGAEGERGFGADRIRAIDEGGYPTVAIEASEFEV